MYFNLFSTCVVIEGYGSCLIYDLDRMDKYEVPKSTWQLLATSCHEVATVLTVLIIGFCVTMLGMEHTKRFAFQYGGTMFGYPHPKGLQIQVLAEMPFLGMVYALLVVIAPSLFASLAVANRIHPLVILIAAIIFAQFATLYSFTINWRPNSLWLGCWTFYSWLVFALLASGASAWRRRRS